MYIRRFTILLYFAIRRYSHMQMSSCSIIFILLFFCGKFDCCTACSEHAVKKVIFDGYDNQLRPVKNQSTVTDVEIDMSIASIIAVNEQEETIELLVWIFFTWTDEFLRWNPSDFGGCEIILILKNNIWMPDFFFYNTIEIKDIGLDELIYAKIYSNGTVHVPMPQHTVYSCTFDIGNFPFDTQKCNMTASSWSYNSSYVSYHLPVNNTEYAVNANASEFETISFTAYDVTTAFLDGGYSELHYTLVLKRRPEYYIFVLLIPSFLLATLCIIGIFTPNSSLGERNEKMTLGLTCLLSMAVILNITADEMPKSSKGLPLLGYYILYEIGVCSLSTILATVIIVIHERAATENWNPPALIQLLASIPSPCGCFKRILQSTKQPKISSSSDEKPTTEITAFQNDKTFAMSRKFSINSTPEGIQSLTDLRQLILKLDKYLKNMSDTEERMGIWISALHKIDLFCLVTLLIANCILTAQYLS